jgi:hypothetical protein
MKSANRRQVKQQDRAMEKLSKRQKYALAMALWIGNRGDRTHTVFARRIKQLLLRAFVIYQRRQQLSPDQLEKYHLDCKRRLKQCLTVIPEGQNRYKTKIPFYLFFFLEQTFTVTTNVASEKSLAISKSAQVSESVICQSHNPAIWFYYYSIWVKFVEWFIDISGKNSAIVKLKKFLGYISLIPISVGGENIKVRGIGINYHDLYHLEVAQLDRILMGKNWVSGIHGINTAVFHDAPIIEEYDGYLDEARIAIHEGLTRTTAFSLVKTFCWLILLILHGINPLAVLMRHLQSLKKKQEELIDAAAV